MAISIANKISDIVAKRLRQITAVNGFENTVSQVIRPKRIETITPRSYSIFINQQGPTRNAALSCPGNPPATAWDITFMIRGVIRPSEAESTPADTLKNQFWGDVVKAICDPPASWYKFEGNAIQALFQDITQVEFDDGTDLAFDVGLLVTYRTDETNPFNLRG